MTSGLTQLTIDEIDSASPTDVVPVICAVMGDHVNVKDMLMLQYVHENLRYWR